MDKLAIIEQSQQMVPRANWKVWQIDEAIKGAAAAVPLDVVPRLVRFDLARYVFNKPIESYNELSGGQIHALYNWATKNGLELKDWLEETYGRQLAML